MEDIFLNFHFEDSLMEPLRPLTPESKSGGKLKELDSNLDQLATRENIERFQNQFTDISKDFEELESFDWLADEKSMNLLMLQNTHSMLMDSRDNAALMPSHTLPMDNYDIKQTILPSNTTTADKFIANGVELNESDMSYVPSYNEIATALDADTLMLNIPDVLSMSSNLFQPEDLTPPASPKNENIISLLNELKTECWGDLLPTKDCPTPPQEMSLPVASNVSELLPPGSAPEPCHSAPVSIAFDSAASSPAIDDDSSSDDPDYLPYPSRSRVEKKRSNSSRSMRGRVTKPYAVTGEKELKSRKKEQNRNAASRYRMKKKMEVNGIKEEEASLLKKNAELRLKLEDINREIKCIKSLLREVYFKLK